MTLNEVLIVCNWIVITDEYQQEETMNMLFILRIKEKKKVR